MFSSLPPRRRRLLALGGLACTLVACGKKGDPLPPPRNVPAAASDLAVRQRGLEVVLDLGYPKTTAAGLPLAGLEALEVWQLARPRPAEGPAPTVDLREFTAAAKPFVTLAGAELASAVAGDRLEVRFQLPEAAVAGGPEIHFYSVRTRAKGGGWSDRSNLAALPLRRPPPPPAHLTVAATAEGIDVSWHAVETAVGYNVYRRDATVASYGKALGGVAATATSYRDGSARFGQRYIYAVGAVAARDPLIESGLAAEREVDYLDRFAPPPPVQLAALPGDGQVRLVWEPSAAADVASYRVYRRDPEADWRLVTPEGVAGREFIDRGLARGLVFRYRIAAVDGAGNEGAASAEVDALLP